MDGLVRHHEVLAEFGLGSGPRQVRGKLDFPDDEPSGVPVPHSDGDNRTSSPGGAGQTGPQQGGERGEEWTELWKRHQGLDRELWEEGHSLLLYLLIWVVGLHGEVRPHLKVHAAGLH